MQVSRSIDILLRLGVGFAFLFPALNAFFDPYAWVGYFPSFVRGVLPDMVLLHVFGIIEIALAVWLFSGRKIFVPAVATTALLFLIVLLNLGDFQVLFRDISIMMMSLALVVLHRPRRSI